MQTQNWTEITISTTTASADLISDLLISLGSSGTMIEDRSIVPTPEDHGDYWELVDPAIASRMPEDVRVHGWFDESGVDEAFYQQLHHHLEQLRQDNPEADLGTLAVNDASVPDQDWTAEWRRHYKPFRIGKTIVVKPSWENYVRKKGDRIIEMDPGMAFGSGTHETTALCMEMLEERMQIGDNVVDLGTGSGILAIAAALLGASRVLALDIDDGAVKVAEDNVRLNHLSHIITCQRGSLLPGTLSDGTEIPVVSPRCHVLVANIVADVILAALPAMKKAIIPGGYLLCSGIIRDRREEVANGLKAAGMQVIDTRHRGEWVAFAARCNEGF